MFNFKIVDKISGVELISTFPPEFESLDLSKWTSNVQIIKCEIINQRRRQKRIDLDSYIVYATSYGSDDSQRRFDQLLSACIFFSENVFPSYIVKKYSKQQSFKRLRHNIVNLSVNISNEVNQ